MQASHASCLLPCALPPSPPRLQKLFAALATPDPDAPHVREDAFLAFMDHVVAVSGAGGRA
jgi:hypothetical protein